MPTHDAQMLKGVLSLLLLNLLAVQESYGYAVVTRLREAGFADLAEGTVYPALTRLESQGFLTSRLVASDSGPARKYYRTTAAGLTDLATRTQSWKDLVASVDSTLSHPVSTTPGPTSERTAS
ncbi:MAG: PadR family transcriptional regulator [Phycicoccus sp.]|nr:PadR family transcriptional regulator [Phycicoccus sp.]